MRKQPIPIAVVVASAILAIAAAGPDLQSTRPPNTLERSGRSHDLLCTLAQAWPPPVTKRHQNRSRACSEEDFQASARIVSVGDDRRRALLVHAGKAHRAMIDAGPGQLLRFSVAALGKSRPLDVEVTLMGKTGQRRWQQRITTEDAWVDGEVPWPTDEQELLRMVVAVQAIAGEGSSGRIAFAEPRLITPVTTDSPGVPNIVLYVIDTLRADHTPLYGYHRNTTPRLARFANESVLFENAYSTAALTRPALASIFTGTYPSYHQAYRGKGLAQQDVTLAERLRANGWSSWAHVANANVFAAPLAFEQGFDIFRSVRGRLGQYARTSEINQLLLPLLAQRADEPFFLFVHAVDPHSPYDPPAGFAGTFQDASYQGDLEPQETRARLLENREMSPADVARVRDLYDEEVLYQDAMFGEFLDALEKLGLTDKTLIVVTGDHGEEFSERGGWEHGGRLYEEQIRIPLIVRIPEMVGNRGRRIRQAISLVDLPSTVAGLYGLPSVPQAQGRDLSRPLLQPSTDFPQAAIYAEETMRPEVGTLHTLIVDHWKLIRSPASPPKEAPSAYSLFDLQTDPGERIDRAAENPSRLNRMIEELATYSARIEKRSRRGEGPVKLGERTHRQLQALGYLETP